MKKIQAFTIEEENITWLKKTAKETNMTISDLLDNIIEYYRFNKKGG